MRPGTMPGPLSISGTRTEPSKKHILNHNPRSPSMSPWSEQNMMMVSSAMRVRIEHGKQFADLVVDIGDIGEIAAPGAANIALP